LVAPSRLPEVQSIVVGGGDMNIVLARLLASATVFRRVYDRL
jgi:hypothetical protein